MVPIIIQISTGKTNDDAVHYMCDVSTPNGYRNCWPKKLEGGNNTIVNFLHVGDLLFVLVNRIRHSQMVKKTATKRLMQNLAIHLEVNV